MDQIKTGKFIAELRRKNNMTQESLGEKLGVTNKTISRWENGNYMPDIEMLELLGKVFNVSINELLCGEKLTGADFKRKADENIIRIYKRSGFTIKEQSAFWKQKWLREHAAAIIVCAVILAGLFAWAWQASIPWLYGACPLLCLAVYAIIYNRMMIYIESRIYPQAGNKTE